MRRPLLALALLVPGVPAVARAQLGDGALHASIFADFNYLDSQRPVAEGFKLGQVAGHLTWGMSERATLFTEATATGQATGFAVEFERVLLRYDFRDWLKLSAGRGHTPISYWNTAFHHGQWLQTTEARPEMVRGGNVLVPMHFVGVFGEGSVPVGPAAVTWSAGLGNGRGTSIGRGGDAGDVNNSRAAVASAALRMPRLANARIGGSLYTDRITPNAGVDVRERLLGAHFALERETPELIVEYVSIRHDPTRPAGRAVTTTASYYAQLAYRLPGRAQRWKPYARYDNSRVPAGDTIFSPLRLNYDGFTAGARYDIGAIAAMKLEYRGERIERGPRLRTIAASLSFTLSGHGGRHEPEEPVLTDDEHEGHEKPAKTDRPEKAEKHTGHDEARRD
jgi:hypothetical protein